MLNHADQRLLQTEGRVEKFKDVPHSGTGCIATRESEQSERPMPNALSEGDAFVWGLAVSSELRTELSGTAEWAMRSELGSFRCSATKNY
jgi:hypothetical protein